MTSPQKWFGPSLKEIWGQVASETGANFVSGGFWKGNKLQATHKNWTVTLDIHVVNNGKMTLQFTRIRAPYLNPDQFRFALYRKGIFSDLGKFMGMQDLTTGHPVFDEAFIIKGNDEEKVRQLFSNPRIRELISAQKNIHLKIKDDDGIFGKKFPEKVDELEFEVLGIIKDPERLKQLFDLFAELLDELCKMGSAYENDPGLNR